MLCQWPINLHEYNKQTKNSNHNVVVFFYTGKNMLLCEQDHKESTRD